MTKDSTLIYFVHNFQSDSEFFEEGDLNATLNEMENLEGEPSNRTIENILNFARSYEVFETKEAGYVEMILN